MNFIFISPNFPKNYYLFCRSLKRNGVNVLGIGDAPFDELRPELRESLTEYYRVGNLNNFDEERAAVQYFQDKYGHIDWLESHNEYWLIKDAALRTEFGITTGLQNDKIDGIKYKSKMKEFYRKAGVATARFHLVSDYYSAQDFIARVGYPVVVKPDNGVGASQTYKLSSNEELKKFFDTKDDKSYIMEEYINGELLSFDGIAGQNKEILFKTAHAYPVPVMELVNDQIDVIYYSYREIPKDLEEAGTKVVEAFDTNGRFFHTEFFRMLEDKPGLGKKGDIIGLEVNMRPPGGYTPDMMNYANDIDVYQIYANMVCYNEGRYETTRPYSCVYAARRDGSSYMFTKDAITDTYAPEIVMSERMPDVLAGAMGNDMVTARFNTEEDSIAFANMYLKKA